MERIRELDNYQKFILVVLVLMVLVFAVLYAVTVSRVGYEYMDEILVPAEENGTTVYSGEIKGTPAAFTVTSGKAVTFQYGDKTYGPYTAREDKTAVPAGESGTGVVVYCQGKVIFRGSVRLYYGGRLSLTNADGTSPSGTVTITTANGTVTDEHGNIIDPMEPSVGTVLRLMDGPELTHKGTWWGWVLGVVFCGMNAISILFADELFRWHLMFRVRDAWDAEPSDWEISSRYIAWTVMPCLILYLFTLGLR